MPASKAAGGEQAPRRLRFQAARRRIFRASQWTGMARNSDMRPAGGLPGGATKMAERAQHEAPKWVYAFAAGYVDGRASMTELLGGKGANLAEMASLGLPVPPGFTITTEVCTAY